VATTGDFQASYYELLLCFELLAILFLPKGTLGERNTCRVFPMPCGKIRLESGITSRLDGLQKDVCHYTLYRKRMDWWRNRNPQLELGGVPLLCMAILIPCIFPYFLNAMLISPLGVFLLLLYLCHMYLNAATFV